MIQKQIYDCLRGHFRTKNYILSEDLVAFVNKHQGFFPFAMREVSTLQPVKMYFVECYLNIKHPLADYTISWGSDLFIYDRSFPLEVTSHQLSTALEQYNHIQKFILIKKTDRYRLNV